MYQYYDENSTFIRDPMTISSRCVLKFKLYFKKIRLYFRVYFHQTHYNNLHVFIWPFDGTLCACGRAVRINIHGLTNCFILTWQPRNIYVELVAPAATPVHVEDGWYGSWREAAEKYQKDVRRRQCRLANHCRDFLKGTSKWPTEETVPVPVIELIFTGIAADVQEIAVLSLGLFAISHPFDTFLFYINQLYWTLEWVPPGTEYRFGQETVTHCHMVPAVWYTEDGSSSMATLNYL